MLAALAERLLAKWALGWAALASGLASALTSALAKVSLLLEGTADNVIGLLARLVAQSPQGKQLMADWLLLLWQALSTYWLVLLLAVATAALLVAGGHLPLAWRALAVRRPQVFISFQNRRECQARELASVLDADRFRVLRVPYAPAAGHQDIVIAVTERLRRADALVCLPGQDASFVEAEVAAATVDHKPVVFLIAAGGSLPNTADKQHPAFIQESVAAQHYAPVALLLHHITQDFTSARMLHRAARAHPALRSAFVWALLVLAVASMLLFVAAVVHGSAVIPQAAVAGVPDAASLRWQAIVLMAVALSIAAAVLLPFAAWLLLVTRLFWLQLRAARRAALRVRTGEFVRADWIGIMPGLQPGQAVFEAMQVRAPRAHHEMPALDRSGPG